MNDLPSIYKNILKFCNIPLLTLIFSESNSPYAQNIKKSLWDIVGFFFYLKNKNVSPKHTLCTF